jgi:hypothetical protein
LNIKYILIKSKPSEPSGEPVKAKNNKIEKLSDYIKYSSTAFPKRVFNALALQNTERGASANCNKVLPLKLFKA